VDCHLRAECLLPAARNLEGRRAVAVDQELSRHGYRNGVSVLDSRREQPRAEDMRKRNFICYSLQTTLKRHEYAIEAQAPPPVLRLNRQLHKIHLSILAQIVLISWSIDVIFHTLYRFFLRMRMLSNTTGPSTTQYTSPLQSTIAVRSSCLACICH
jgi:hypothetical protein